MSDDKKPRQPSGPTCGGMTEKWKPEKPLACEPKKAEDQPKERPVQKQFFDPAQMSADEIAEATWNNRVK